MSRSIIPEVKAVRQLKQYYQMIKDAQDSMKGGGKRRKKTRKRRRKKTKEKDVVEIRKLVEKKVESNYMSKRRFNHNDKLWIAKEEVKDLERLLKEAEERLNLEYEKVGGRTRVEWVWYLLGYRYN